MKNAIPCTIKPHTITITRDLFSITFCTKNVVIKKPMHYVAYTKLITESESPKSLVSLSVNVVSVMVLKVILKVTPSKAKAPLLILRIPK
jgi:hypothetical protein